MDPTPLTPTPIEISERPWEEPGLPYLSGLYRFRLPSDPSTAGDHLVVYVRGSGGVPDDCYVGRTTICGAPLKGAARPTRIAEACAACFAGVGQAFRAARAALADPSPSRLE